jgi:hypothetical protein
MARDNLGGLHLSNAELKLGEANNCFGVELLGEADSGAFDNVFHRPYSDISGTNTDSRTRQQQAAP